MAQTKLQLTAELARRHFNFDPKTGALTWREPRASRVKIGDAVGGINGNGYRNFQFAGFNHKAHRVAWLIHYGEWPSDCVDHINGDRTDNRIENLRIANQQENSQNRRSPHRKDKVAALLGTSFHKPSGQFQARIGMPDGTQRYLGIFPTAEAAHAVYAAAKRQYHGACTI